MNKMELASSSKAALVFSIRNPFVDDVLNKNAYITKSISKDELYASGKYNEYGF